MDAEELTMMEMMDTIEKSMNKIHTGEILKGTVISVTEQEVLVNIGYIADGIIKKEELSAEQGIDPREQYKTGDEINVYVLKLNDGEGNVILSEKRADRFRVWDELAEVYEKKQTISVEIKELTKGGGLAYIKGVRAFIPASHISKNYVEDLSSFVGKTLFVRVIELDPENKKIILSRKVVEQDEAESMKQKAWTELEKGQKRQGVVTKLMKFGAFVDLGGIEGLIHLSELSWKRVKDPSEVVSVGDKVEVYILDLDQEKGRISLGLKDVNQDPWENIDKKYKAKDIVEGIVVKIINIGVFVEIEPGLEGLVHISEIAEERILKASDVLSVGDTVQVKILDIRKEEHKISLSIKEAENTIKNEDIPADYSDDGEMGTLGDLFKEKFKDLNL